MIIKALLFGMKKIIKPKINKETSNSNIKNILKNKIIKSIENGDLQNIKSEIEAYEKLCKIGFFEEEKSDEIFENHAKKRQKLIYELERRLKKLGSGPN